MEKFTAENTIDALAASYDTDAPLAQRCVVGFDGFIDHIASAVDKRLDVDTYTTIDTISAFGQRVVAAAGRNTNIELVVKEIKLGGNGPIMAESLLQQGFPLSYIGTIGPGGHVEQPFQAMASRCDSVHSIAASGHTDALEFLDGKILLGKLTPLHSVTFDTLKTVVGIPVLTHTLEACDLLATVNWTMLPHMTSIWQGLLQEVVPRLSKKPRWLFVDLADPSKRSRSDLQEALEKLRSFCTPFRVILGINHSEAEQVAETLAIASKGVSLEVLAEKLQKHLGYAIVMIHTKNEVTATSGEQTATLAVPLCQQPKLATGAGDNFNAGFVGGLLHGHPLEGALAAGIATAGYYIRHGASPRRKEIAAFLREHRLTSTPNPRL